MAGRTSNIDIAQAGELQVSLAPTRSKLAYSSLADVAFMLFICDFR